MSYAEFCQVLSGMGLEVHVIHTMRVEKRTPDDYKSFEVDVDAQRVLIKLSIHPSPSRE